MKKRILFSALAAVGVVSMPLTFSVRPAHAFQVFQAAAPAAPTIPGQPPNPGASILDTVEAFRAALGDPNNGNAPGPPLGGGRREINWDGGGSTATTAPVTPFDVFLNTRGARFTTRGAGLSQAPPSGLATLFGNETYGQIFSTFSSPRLFTPVGSRITEGAFFVPGANPTCAPPSCPDVELVAPATVRGFGAIFTDVDNPNGSPGKIHNTQIEYFDTRGRRIFLGLVPSSPGDGGLSFFGVVFNEPVIARIRITTDTNPGVDDGPRDIVMMDDFFYSEPQPVQ